MAPGMRMADGTHMNNEAVPTSRRALRVRRRELLRGAAAIGYGALLAACGQEAGDRSSAPAIAATAAATSAIIVPTRLPSPTPVQALAANPIAFVSRIDHDLQ